jgi:hypothetical protein
VNWSAILSVIKSEPTVFLAGLKTIVANPTLMTDLLAAEKSGQWLPFIETHLSALLPWLNTLVAALEANPALLQALLSALSTSTT